MQLVADLDLTKATTLARQSEVVHRQQQDLRGGEGTESNSIALDAIRRGGTYPTKSGPSVGRYPQRRCPRCARGHGPD